MIHVKNYGRVVHRASIIIYIVLLLCIGFYLFKHPAYNPDMVSYMAIARGIGDDNFIEVHNVVYRDLEKYLPPAVYSNLTDEVLTPVTKVYHDPNRLLELVPQHSVKPLYLLAVRCFQFAGLNPVQATVAPGIISFIILGVILLLWIRPWFSNVGAMILCIPLMCMAPILSSVRLSTPDVMASMLFLAGAYLLLEKRNILPGCLLMILSFYTRLDLMIPGLLLFIVLFYRKNISLITLALLCLSALAVYVSVFLIFVRDEWNIFYFKDFITIYTDEHGLDRASFRLPQVVLSGFVEALRTTHLSIFIFLGLIPFAIMNLKKWFKANSDTMIVLALFLSIFIRSILHPYLLDRFFLVHYLLIAIICLKCIYYGGQEQTPATVK